MDLLKRAALPSIEDFAKEIAVKKKLTSELGRSIRTIQEENVGKSILTDDERSYYLCSVLEAVFIHGLKDKLTQKMSSVFGSNSEKIPEPQFWTVVRSYSHKNVVQEINQFNLIISDIGRGRAWLRATLNDGLIGSYIGNMLRDKSSLQKYYTTSAYLRDDEQSDIMKQLLEGVSIFTFELSCNNSTLNVWNSPALTLANLWTPPATPQPVMPAVDVIDFFAESKHHGKTTKHYSKHKEPSICDSGSSSEVLTTSIPETESETQSPNNDACSLEDCNKSLFDKPSKEDNIEKKVEPEQTIENPDCDLSQLTNEGPISQIEESSSKISSYSVKKVEPEQTIENPDCDLPQFTDEGPISQIEESSSKMSSSDSVPDFDLEIIEDSSDAGYCAGNKLIENSGWSSTFESDRESNCDIDQSYDSLLQSYNKNLSKVVIGTPEIANTFSEVMEKEEENSSLDAKSPDLDFEFVPKYLSPENADGETKKLMAALYKIHPEQGLDAQNFQCYSCGRPIGLIYGKARLCHYDGHSYCYECHENEEEIIPARIIHNWDFKQYTVSKRAKIFLNRVLKDPLLDIKLLNPIIYMAIEEMAQMQLLRTQLTFLRSYIFTCKQSIAEDLRLRLWPREYLYEHVHLYAIDDLLEIPSGVLAQTLQKVISFAKKHVLRCQLCLLKGFICEVCKNPKAIYPFDVESTFHCEKCLAVYHAICMDVNKYCPKCVRKMKRQEILDSTASD